VSQILTAGFRSFSLAVSLKGASSFKISATQNPTKCRTESWRERPVLLFTDLKQTAVVLFPINIECLFRPGFKNGFFFFRFGLFFNPFLIFYTGIHFLVLTINILIFFLACAYVVGFYQGFFFSGLISSIFKILKSILKELAAPAIYFYHQLLRKKNS